MEFALSPAEQRVLGCLMEKAVTTPEVYPLSLNSIVTACNQRSNRNPVVDYDEATVQAALDSLREQGFVRRVDAAGSRTAKFRHLIGEVLPLNNQQQALFCVLLLRGPQTVGELRSRSERLFAFRDLEQAQRALDSLAEPSEDAGLDAPLVAALPRRAGSREIRYVQLLGESSDQVHDVSPESEAGPVQPLQARASKAEVEELRAEVADLKSLIAAMREELDSFKAEFR